VENASEFFDGKTHLSDVNPIPKTGVPFIFQYYCLSKKRSAHQLRLLAHIEIFDEEIPIGARIAR